LKKRYIFGKVLSLNKNETERMYLMAKDNTKRERKNQLLEKLFELIERHRPAFKQERPYERAVWLLLSELFTFARHTVTQGLLALGETENDWSAWYRLFSKERFDYQALTTITLRETIAETQEQEPYVVGADGVLVPRSSRKMPGTSWWKALGSAPFRPGLARAQRFVNLSWLTPLSGGYSRAIPLQMIPAFPEKAVPAAVDKKKDWEAAIDGLKWVRQTLDAVGRQEQMVLALVDGGFERTVEFWRQLPERTVLLGRTARSRALYHLPGDYQGRGRPNSYGERARKPFEWLHLKEGWTTTHIGVRGHAREMRYRVEGPFVRDGLPEQPVFLIVVRGIDRKVNGKHVKRDPVFYLVSAVHKGEQWVLPLPIQQLLAWAWQRWELEVAHREMKSGFGLGEKQCWNQRSAVRSVQWSAWVYALLLLTGYRTWGLQNGPASPARWWKGAGRWSFNTLWRALRSALWGTGDFKAVCLLTTANWQKKSAWLSAFRNSAAAAARF
jgi:hypothetical protein